MNKYKIVATTWHVMHYWDLCNALKDDADFYLIHNTHRSWLDPRFQETRGIPENVHFVPYFESGKYDLAILNCDQQLVNQDLGKYKIMKQLFTEIEKDDIPLAVINHGSPVYPEFLQDNEMTRIEAEVKCRNLIKELVKDHTMVVNSFTAATEKEWGWGYPIWHGMNKDEWYDLPKEPRIFTALSPAGCDTYYNRYCMDELVRVLDKDYGYKMFWARHNCMFSSPEKYKEFLGRSLIYVDTSFRTPMNRARTEAMLSGCCVIQVEGAHDLERFAKDGENIILAPNDPREIAKACIKLIEEKPDEAIRIGENGRQTAIKYFNRERYRQDWLKLIKQLTEKK